MQDGFATKLDEIARHRKLRALWCGGNELGGIEQAIAALAYPPLDIFRGNLLRQQGTRRVSPTLEIGFVFQADKLHQIGSNNPSCCGATDCCKRCFKSLASRLLPGL